MNPSSLDLPVRIERPAAGVAAILLDRPKRRNALSLEVKSLIADAVEELTRDDTIASIVISGTGGYFVAGTDIAEMVDMTPLDHVQKETDRVFKVLSACPKPVIAAVEGYALGGGCELALCCDLIVAGETAKFGQPEIRVGIMPGAGGTQRLLRTIGRYRTARLVLTGEPVDAQLAFAMGMVSELCEDGGAFDRAVALARSLVGMPPLAVRAIKRLLAGGEDAPLSTMLAAERQAFEQLFATEDQKEGMRAFLEKRPPVYRGR